MFSDQRQPEPIAGPRQHGLIEGASVFAPLDRRSGCDGQGSEEDREAGHRVLDLDLVPPMRDGGSPAESTTDKPRQRGRGLRLTVGEIDTLGGPLARVHPAHQFAAVTVAREPVEGDALRPDLDVGAMNPERRFALEQAPAARARRLIAGHDDQISSAR